MNTRILSAASLLLLAVLTGCVSSSAYNQALRDLQSAKSDLERVRAQNEELNKQIIGVKEALNNAVAQERQIGAKLKEETEKSASQRVALESRLKEAEQQMRELMALKQTLSQEMEVAKQRYEDSLKIQKRQAKELKEREQLSLRQSPTQPVQPSPPIPPKPESTSPATP